MIRPEEIVGKFYYGPDHLAAHALARFLVGEYRAYGGTQGKKPSAVAGAASYLAGIFEGPFRTQLEVANLSGRAFTEVTLRSIYFDMAKRIPELPNKCAALLESLPAHQRWKGPKYPKREDGSEIGDTLPGQMLGVFKPTWKEELNWK